MRYRTIVRLGSSEHPEYVGKKLFDIAKDYACMHPAVARKFENLIRYDVPPDFISGHADNTKRYYAEVDHKCERVETEAVKTFSEPVVVRKAYAKIKEEYDRAIIHREAVFPNSFLLKETSQFSHVNFIHTRTDSHVEYYSGEWIVRFEEIYVCAYHSLMDPTKLVFNCRPQYKIEIHKDGFPDYGSIKDFVSTALPRLFQFTN
jgi:hypothetical protein